MVAAFDAFSLMTLKAVTSSLDLSVMISPAAHWVPFVVVGAVPSRVSTTLFVLT